MPEAGRHAPILIAASYQALQRLDREEEADARVTNSMVVIFFAGVFLEANLNHIAAELEPKHSLGAFCTQKNPSLEAKLGWFYNEFVASQRVASSDQLFANKGQIRAALEHHFPGFQTLHEFRNDLAHGTVNDVAGSVDNAIELRRQTKVIVDKLFAILKTHGYDIPRDTNYFDALREFEERVAKQRPPDSVPRSSVSPSQSQVSIAPVRSSSDTAWLTSDPGPENESTE